jgi:5-methylcytosine-specific restriction enzyme subunit McrC
MLAVAGNMPFSERDLAGQESVRDSLLEVLITAFVRRLQAEMRRGVDHEYQDVQENCPYLRGKLQVVEHIRKNIAHRERFAVRYSVFGTDTRINRILKASCARLHHLTSSLRNRTALSHVMQLFEPVEDAPVSPTEFQRIVYTRSSERFRPLIDFCRLLSTGQSPTLSGGTATQTFSLLFPMERVFEAFVSRFAVRHAQRLGLRSEHIHVQAHRRTRHLLRDERGRPIYRLEPDLLIDGPDGPVVLDTKWKRLDALSRVTSVRPSQADIYQLHAYATRYGATRTILLFPRVPDASPRAWTMEGNPQQHLLVRFLDLSHDLRTHSEILLQTLAEAIHGAEVLVDNA